ncbi:hypothetical protein ACFV80_36850 [Streptomyces sp. NPDC059862]|uniref:hypothetical protein n=1 Tax=Streptomyces sp. NPDC059862 TaxID=3346975 RepID=UPI00365AA11A
MIDVAAKEAEIAQFLHAYPQAADAGRGHPALRGCEDVRWSEFRGCPAAIPVLLHSLLDQAAASEAKRVLSNAMHNSIREMNAAMPTVLPFLLRLVVDPHVPGRSKLVDLLVTAAQFAEPVDENSEAAVSWFGSDSDHPEREQCRAVFAEHASVVAMLPQELISPAGQAALRQAAGLV